MLIWLFSFEKAIERGVYFEINYRPAIRDATARRYIISNAQRLVSVSKGKVCNCVLFEIGYYYICCKNLVMEKLSLFIYYCVFFLLYNIIISSSSEKVEIFFTKFLLLNCINIQNHVSVLNHKLKKCIQIQSATNRINVT